MSDTELEPPPVQLRPDLAQRLEPTAPPVRAGDFVLYWMRVAMRAHENPALDVARSAAAALGLPMFVYQGLSSRTPHASDRVHTFILEGAREVAEGLAAQGIGSCFHLERPGDGKVLLTLASSAAVVVTDYLPRQPLLTWDAQVAKVAPLWRVDASCVVPCFSFPKAFERPNQFREALEPLLEQWLAAPYRALELPAPTRPWLPPLPFAPVDFSAVSIPELVASCDIDHTITPVHHTPGGTKAALARWRAFKESRLDRYRSDRNDPSKEGTSRLSPYFHFGQLSAFSVACEAKARRSEGAATFLEELVLWRELAWNFCRHHGRHDSVEALPAWARETLEAHVHDRRLGAPSWEQLARAQTEDPVWNAAQHELMTHGQLHPAMRMRWGKALLEWTRTPQAAFTLGLELNDRFALDGRDPASVTGVGWCLGLFDRPFFPSVPILGSVRPQPTQAFAKRFDVAEYTRRARRPARGQPLTVAVVGAGVAGAAAARALVDAGHVVTLFDKGRGPGGRLSTRREGELSFDHGAPFFTVRDERFAKWARAWWQERVLTQWPVTLEGATEPHAHDLVKLVGQPGMSHVVERLLRGLDVRFGVHVDGLVRDGERWRLVEASGAALGEFEVVVVAVPAPQAASLVDPASYALASRLRSEVQFAPCWALLAAFEQATGAPFEALVSQVGPLSMLLKSSSKPMRAHGSGERWVLHASRAWSEAHLEDDGEKVAAALLEAFFATSGTTPQTPSFIKAHRWRFARVVRALGEPCVWDEPLRLGLCGDWCLGDRVEAAFLSGSALAGRINAVVGAPADIDPPLPPPRQLELIGPRG